MPQRDLRRALSVAALAVVVSAAAVSAQLPASVDTALHQIFSGRLSVGGVRFGPARWSADGRSYTTLERSSDGSTDIVRYDAASGARTVIVPSHALKPAGAAQSLEIEDYQWSDDGKLLLVFTHTERVWRQNTRGDYWVLNVAAANAESSTALGMTRNRALRKLGGSAPASTLMYAKFSPDSKRVAYVRQGELYVEPVAGGAPLRLTHDASRSRVNGMTDWVYEEEFGLRDAFRWSPDGKSLAFWQFDMSGVRDFLLINDTDSLYPFATPVQYPPAGTRKSSVRLGVLSADGKGKTVWAQIPGDAREKYLPRAEWTSANEIVVQSMDRLQQHNDVRLVDARTGTSKVLFTEHDSAWVDVVDDFQWTPDRALVWLSERDGWRHVYLAPHAGGAPTLVTPGAYDVISLVRVDDAHGWIYFIASPENPTQQYLYRASLRMPGAPVRVSPADQPGSHSYTIASGAKWAFHTYSRSGLASVTELVSLPDHQMIRQLGKDGTIAALRMPEFFRVGVADGTQLDGWMIKPKDFDASKRYPVLMFVYGEPAGQTVLDRAGGGQDMWHQTLADQGYIVMSMDPRGTPAPRGRAWRKVVYGAIGVLSSRDLAEAMRTMTRTRSYLDSTRVGVWGWSGGGSSTLNAMFRYPDVFSVGMSVAPVPDQRLYDTIYQERYMGTPQLNPTGYEQGSPMSFAAGLKGKLLVVHGSGDDNVHYQGTERLINKLVSLDKQFDVMVYPNRSHCICEGEGTTLHIYSTLTRYLLNNLPAGGR